MILARELRRCKIAINGINKNERRIRDDVRVPASAHAGVGCSVATSADSIHGLRCIGSRCKIMRNMSLGESPLGGKF